MDAVTLYTVMERCTLDGWVCGEEEGLSSSRYQSLVVKASGKFNKGTVYKLRALCLSTCSQLTSHNLR